MKIKLIFLVLLFCSCNNNTFSGHVYDYDTGEPITGIQIYSSDNKTETDSSGYFSIKVKANKICKISLRKEGYETKNISRKPDSLGIFSKRNLKGNKIYLWSTENDF